MYNSDVFVKLSLENIGEVKNLILNQNNIDKNNNGKYLMCAGKYDKNGWTIVFKAKNYKEAEYIIEHTPFNNGRIYSRENEINRILN